jgi:polar amino acid transport system permease protein
MQFLTEQFGNWRFYLVGAYPAGPVGGLAVNLLLTVICLSLGLAAGIIIGLGRLSRRPLLRWPCATFVEVIRAIPAVLLIFWFVFFLPTMFGRNLPLFWGAVFGLSVYAAAYQAEIVRAGVLAVPVGQLDAAIASGMRRMQAARLVILPQALRLMLPAFASFAISLFKDTSIVYIIGVVDLVQTGVIVSQRQPNRMFAAYICMAIGFFAVCRGMASLGKALEKRCGALYIPQSPATAIGVSKQPE